MKSPLLAALGRYLDKKRERLHMPGHKGLLPTPLDGCAPFDVTELPDTGCLYDGEGAPVETEALFSNLYGSGATLLSAGGSTLCIQAMLALHCPEGSKVLMTRAAHHAAVNAAAVLNLEPVWLSPDEITGVQTPARISPQAVEAALLQNPGVSAVYLTSPDYFGTLCDIKAISAIAHSHGKPLLVDNAHGAHLIFFDNLHPIALGVDACCDSLHKTLPALTGAALLHLKDGTLADEARRRMATFGSTSPSYLVMLSADLLLPQWEVLKSSYTALAQSVAQLRSLALEKGIWATCANLQAPVDPVRISLLFAEGQRDTALSLLQDCGIEAEYLSPRHIVLIPGPQNNLTPVEKLIAHLPALHEAPSLSLPVHQPQHLLPLRRAVLSPAERLSLLDALGRIAAAPVSPCPPGVALLMPGEILDQTTATTLKSAGITSLFVVK
ncbi:aminotransferase class V-fold PLP-dependent enzyme [Oscillospiraceae bacterium LTW-04]|nr:aminotransferase class V-fold PLP-dependent enzyme [Oscillospiraceae bacterium MB24-C1]